LHKSAGGEERHSPNRWTRTDGYQSLVLELTPELAFAPSESIRGGAAPGTYVCKELVYAYAMWISPAFHLKVNQLGSHGAPEGGHVYAEMQKAGLTSSLRQIVMVAGAGFEQCLPAVRRVLLR